MLWELFFSSSRQLYNPIDFNEVDHTKKEGEKKNRSELKRIKPTLLLSLLLLFLDFWHKTICNDDDNHDVDDDDV